jgi:hypothetical protein
MTKPVTSQEMFDLWQKMVNPGAYPLQSLMFPVLDVKELERKISELQVVEHWLKANLGMLQMSIQSLQFQRSMLEGGEKVAKAMKDGAQGKDAPEPAPNPAMWAWDMMAKASQGAMDAAEAAPGPKKARRRTKG